MDKIPGWIKFNKNWVVGIPYIQGEYEVVDIFKETKRMKKRVASYKQIHHLKELIISDLKDFLIENTGCNCDFNFDSKNSKFLFDTASKFRVTEDEVLKQYFEAGIIGICEYYAIDGIAIKNIRYGLTLSMVSDVENNKNKIYSDNNIWLKKIKEKIKLIEDYKLNNLYLISILDFVKGVIGKCEYEDIVLLPLKDNWVFKKQETRGPFHKAIDFLVSLMFCMIELEIFDWKEIGARSGDKIGSSKLFDGKAKEKLINLVENITKVDISELGLISGGSLYSLYLSGTLKWEYNNILRYIYPDTVNSLTNIQLNDMNSVQHDSKKIIFTENRSVLLKMQMTGWINSSHSLVICIDGNLKHSHIKFFKLLYKFKSEIPTYIWVDGDLKGHDFGILLKSIFPQGKLVSFKNNKIVLYDNIEEWTSNVEYQNREQENIMGGVNEWNDVFG